MWNEFFAHIIRVIIVIPIAFFAVSNWNLVEDCQKMNDKFYHSSVTKAINNG